jgi:hypothetical protein
MTTTTMHTVAMMTMLDDVPVRSSAIVATVGLRPAACDEGATLGGSDPALSFDVPDGVGETIESAGVGLAAPSTAVGDRVGAPVGAAVGRICSGVVGD